MLCLPSTAMRVLILSLITLAAGVSAQPLAWETVGVEEARSPGPPLIRPDGSLYSGGFYRHPDGYNVYGVLRLDAPWGPGQHWTQLYPEDFNQSNKPITSFHPDTVFTYDTTRFSRSVDGGMTFDPLPEPAACKWSRLIEIPAGLPHAGRLLCGDRAEDDGRGYVTYSDDRGDSWHTATAPDETADATVRFLAVLPSGPRAGRLVAGGLWGLGTSDDGGTTWQPTTEWAYFDLSVLGLAVLRGGAPAGGDRVLAVVNGSPYPGNYLLASDDGGGTWAEVWQFPYNATTHHLVDLGGGRALAVPRYGQVFETADGGSSWAEAGVVPHSDLDVANDGDGSARWAWVGPDGRLYVGGAGLAEGESVNRGYTWRTVDAVAVATGEAVPESEALGVSVRPNPSAGGAVTVELTGEGAVRASVVDARGRVVAELFSGELRGARSVALGTAGWAAGVYTVVVESEGARAVEPFTVAPY